MSKFKVYQSDSGEIPFLTLLLCLPLIMTYSSHNRSIAKAFLDIDMSDIFRYIYGKKRNCAAFSGSNVSPGAVFQDLQLLPNIGAYHYSEG